MENEKLVLTNGWDKTFPKSEIPFDKMADFFRKYLK